jgi:hypothetical protein
MPGNWAPPLCRLKGLIKSAGRAWKLRVVVVRECGPEAAQAKPTTPDAPESQKDNFYLGEPSRALKPLAPRCKPQAKSELSKRPLSES